MSLHPTSATLSAAATRLGLNGTDHSSSDRSASPGLFADLLQQRGQTAPRQGNSLPGNAVTAASASALRSTLAARPASTTAHPAPAAEPAMAAARASDRAAAETRGVDRRAQQAAGDASREATRDTERGSEARNSAARADSHRSADARAEANQAQARRTAAANAQRQQSNTRAAATPARTGSARPATGSPDASAADRAVDTPTRARAGAKAGAEADMPPGTTVDPVMSDDAFDPPQTPAPAADAVGASQLAGDAAATTATTITFDSAAGTSSTSPGTDPRVDAGGARARAAAADGLSAPAALSADRSALAGGQWLSPGRDVAGAAVAGAGAAASDATPNVATTAVPGSARTSPLEQAGHAGNGPADAALRAEGAGASTTAMPQGVVGPARADTSASEQVAEAAAQVTTAATDAAASFASALAGASAAAGQRAAAATDGPTGVTAQVHVPVEAPQFGATVMLQVGRFAADGLQQATLNLNPAELGPIQIHIALDGQQASVDFGAAHGRTRELLEAALPQLATALQGDGLTLAGARVGELPQVPVDRSASANWHGPGADAHGSGTSTRADAGQGGSAGGGQPGHQAGTQAGGYPSGTAAMGGERAQRLAGLGWAQPATPTRGPAAGDGRLGLDLYA